jgi:hypothetical protein
MSKTPKSQRLLQQVQTRLMIRQVVQRAFFMTLIIAAVYFTLMLTGRLTGFFPEWFTPLSVLVVPFLALLIAVLLPGKPDRSQAAHAIDEHSHTSDLFLTMLSVESSQSEYKPLVFLEAEEKAPEIDAEAVTPFQWQRSWLWSGIAMAILFLGAFLVPTLDPFGKVAEAKQEEDQKRLIEETAKQTEKRKALLAEKELDNENSEAVTKAIEALKTDFRKMEPGNKKANIGRLNKHQKEIGEKFRKLNSGELKSLNDKMDGQQKLGAIRDQELFRKWQKELQQGSAESMKSEVDKLQDQLERLSKTTDPVEKTELERQIQKKMNELSDFAENKVGSKALQAAIERAKQQLESAKDGKLSKEAMEALKESLDVAQQEMEMLAQSARDMKDLEEALEMISMAKQMNSEGKLDGEMFPGEMTLEDYAELYAQMMGEGMGEGEGEGEGEGDGEGTGGQGFGEGGEVDEDDSINTDFIDEKSKAAIQKGKILLSMKTKGLSDSGDVSDADYKRIVGEIQQSLDDVIEQEQIPPGYLGGIKKYFDTLDKEKE